MAKRVIDATLRRPRRRAELKTTAIGKEAWRVAKARMLATCHELVFGDVKRASFTGFQAACADGVMRKVFPALHTYVSDTPEAQRLAGAMAWPRACYCCNMQPGGNFSLDDITQPGNWAFRTVADHDSLQDEADRLAEEAAAANRAAVRRWESGTKKAASPADATVALRAAIKYCKEHGVIWARTVFRYAARARVKG